MCIIFAFFFPIKLWVNRTESFKNNLKETQRLVGHSAFESLHSKESLLNVFWDKNFTEIGKTMWEVELGVKKTP